MKSYIGSKLIKAEPKYKIVYDYGMGGIETKYVDKIPEAFDGDIEEGYSIIYPDGHKSWSPKDVFEKVYLEVDENPNLPSGVSIGEKMVENFIVDYEVFTKKNKITIVIATLANGFTIVESSACVDEANYDEAIGAEICKEKIQDRVWNYLGFLLQTAWKGVK